MSQTEPTHGPDPHDAARYRSIIENAADHIIIADREGKILFINRIVEPLTMDQVIGTSIFDWVDPEGAAQQKEALRCAVEEGAVAEYEAKSIGHHGAEAWYRTRMSPVRIDGRVQEVILMAFNVTDQHLAEAELRRSRASLVEAQHLARLGSWEWDVATDRVTWSREMCRILGVDPNGTYRAKDFWDRVHPDDLSTMRRHVDAAIEQNDAYDLRIRIVRDDEDERMLHAVGRVVVDDDGKPLRMFGSALDLTDRTEANRQLAESKERLDLAIGSTGLGLWDWNVQTGDAYFSEHWVGMLGYGPDELPGRFEAWDKLLHPEDKDRIGPVLTEHLEGRCPTYEAEIRLKTKDGHWKWIHTNGRVVARDADGKPLRMTGTHRDIHADKEAAIALAESEAKWRSITENSPDYIMTLSLDKRILFINRTVPDLDVDSVLGKRVTEFVPPDFHEVSVSTMDRVIETGKPDGYEVDYVDADGRVHHFEARVGPVLDKNGGVVALTVSSTDITERVRLNEQLRFTQFAVDRHNDAAFWIRPDGSFAYVNESACQRLGYRRQELLSMDVPDIHADTDHAAWPTHFLEVKERGTSTFETAHKTRDGRIFPVEITANYVRYGDEEYICAFARDITERRRAEEQLRFTQFAVDNSGDAAFWIRPDARFVYVNEAACEQLKFDRQTLLTMSVHDINPESSPASWAEHFQDVKANGPIILETTHRDADGELIPIEITANYLHYQGQEYICAFSRDITERQEVEQRIRQQSELLERVVETVPHSVFWKDRNLVYTGCNPRFAREAGVGEPANIIGKTDFDLAWKRQEAEFFRACDREVMDQNKPMTNIEEPQLQSDGTEATLLTSKVPLLDAEGAVAGIVGIYTDITDRKKAELQLIGHQAQLRSLASQVAMAEQAERRRIATGLHDHIGQLMALAKIRLDGLTSQLAASPAREHALEVRRLLDQAIDFTRTLTFQLCPPALYELGLEAAVETLILQFDNEHEASYRFEDDGKAKPISQEVAIVLFQAARELLQNTVKHARAREVAASIACRGGRVTLTVADDGVGMDTGSAEQRPLGGFGLFNIRERLNHFGGQMRIEPGPNGGTTVVLEVALDRLRSGTDDALPIETAGESS